VDPRGPVAEVDLDGLVVEALLGERDAGARAVRARRRVDQPHFRSGAGKAGPCAPWSRPSSLPLMARAPPGGRRPRTPPPPAGGGRSAGEAGVRITCRTVSRSAPVRRATSVGFASSASSSPFEIGPW